MSADRQGYWLQHAVAPGVKPGTAYAHCAACGCDLKAALPGGDGRCCGCYIEDRPRSWEVQALEHDAHVPRAAKVGVADSAAPTSVKTEQPPLGATTAIPCPACKLQPLAAATAVLMRSVAVQAARAALAELSAATEEKRPVNNTYLQELLLIVERADRIADKVVVES